MSVDPKGQDLRPDHQIRPCPHCGLARYRRLVKHGWRWAPCGWCDYRSGHTAAVFTEWEQQRERE